VTTQQPIGKACAYISYKKGQDRPRVVRPFKRGASTKKTLGAIDTHACMPQVVNGVEQPGLVRFPVAARPVVALRRGMAPTDDFKTRMGGDKT
jgi:hypothetical protein